MAFINKYPYTNFHDINLDYILDRISDLEVKMKYLEEEWSKIQVLTEDYIQAMIDRAITAEDMKIQNDLNNLHSRINSERDTYVSQQINSLRNYVDIQDNNILNASKAYTDSAEARSKAYTDDKLVNYTYMYSPITGEYMDVREVVNQMVTYFHSQDSLMASEYDVMDITAEDYDAEEITAYNYDFNGKNLLPPT